MSKNFYFPEACRQGWFSSKTEETIYASQTGGGNSSFSFSLFLTLYFVVGADTRMESAHKN